MKKLVIVCEEKLKRYADFLAQLISRNDASNDNGVAAQVWTEKEYEGNAVQISSEQYIVFIGDSKLMKEKRMHMQIKFSEYGMNYSWLGKQAALYLDKIVSVDEYNDFYDFAQEKYFEQDQGELKKFISDKDINLAVENEKLLNIIPDKIKDNKVFSATTDYAKKKRDNNWDKVNETFKKASLVRNNRAIKDQEYSCLILLFYLEGLNDFLNI